MHSLPFAARSDASSTPAKNTAEMEMGTNSQSLEVIADKNQQVKSQV